MNICVLCHDCKYWFDAGFNVPTCDGVICDNDLGCECCMIYRLGYPCSCFVSLEDGAVGIPSIAPNMDQEEIDL